MSSVLIVSVLSMVDTSARDQVNSYLQLLRDTSGQSAEIRLAVPSDLDGCVDPALMRYHAGSSRAEIYNQIVAEWDGDLVLLLDGPVITSEQVLHTLSQGANYADVPGRRALTASLPTGDSIHQGLKAADFNRDVHPLSPLAILIQRDIFLHIRGFDESKKNAHVLFMDLFHRLQRSHGVLDRRPSSEAWDLGSVYPSLREDPLEVTRAARERFVGQVRANKTLYRNLVRWTVPRALRPIHVTVVIATRNRAKYLGEAIMSVLAQDFTDFELIIVDDGSTDDTAQVVSSFDDPRIRYLRQNPTGISAARNYAADESRGWFTAVHDDDDLMLPWRLSEGLAALDGECMASYGSWVNFDDVTGQLTLHLTPIGFGIELIAHNGQTPGHATWLLPTSWVKRIRYDERLPSSIDHNLAVRTILSGLRWKHTQKVHYLRRLHPSQVSQTDSRRQKSTAMITRFGALFGATHPGMKILAQKGKELVYPKTIDRSRLFEDYGAYLPDHLVRRSATLRGLVGRKVLSLDLHDRFKLIASEFDQLTGKAMLEVGAVDEICWADMVKFQASQLPGIKYRPLAPEAAEANGGPTDPATWLRIRASLALQDLLREFPGGGLLVLTGEEEDVESEVIDEDAVLHRLLTVNFGSGDRRAWQFIGVKSASRASDIARRLRSLEYEVNLLVDQAAQPQRWFEASWDKAKS